MQSSLHHRLGKVLKGMHFCRGICCILLLIIPNVCGIQPASGQSPPFISGVERFSRFGEIDSAATARLLVSELSCVACHRSQRDDLNPKLGPRLEAAGTRLRATWIKQYLQSPHETKPGTTMPDVLSDLQGSDKDAAIDALVAFLASRQQPFPELKAGGANPLEDEFWSKGDPVRGEHLYHQVGCVACHEPGVEVKSNHSSAVDRLLNELDPAELEDLGLASAARKVASVPHSDLANKYTLQSLTHFLHEPERIRPTGRMPNFKLSPNEAADIAEYLLGRKLSSIPPSDDVFSNLTFPEQLIKRGRKLFGSLRCVNCHDAGITIEKTFATDFQDLELDSLDSCLNAGVQPPVNFRLDDFQIETLASSIRDRVFASSQTQDDASDLVRQSLLTLNCFACHEREQIGGVGRYRKPHFEANSLADLGDEGRLPPSLSGVGAKLTNEWLQKVFAGHRSTRLRSQMTIRMPKFPKATVEPLVKALEVADEGTRQSDSDVFGDDQSLAETGKQLTQIGCIQCHAFDGQALPGVIGIDLGGVPDRIRPAWFREFVLDPGGLKRGTRMPSFFPDGVSQSPQILNGNTEKQIAGLWSYLKQSKRIGVPPKIAEALAANYELQPDKQPLILRTFMNGVGTHAIAVGFPEGIHFAIDAKTPRLALAWKDDFIDARSTWFERFTPPIDPLGMDAVVVSTDAEFRIQSSNVSQLSLLPKFVGYHLNSNRVPTFRYRIGDTMLADRVEATREGTLRRTIRVADDEKPIDGTLQFRLLKDVSIEVKDSNRITGASGLSVTISDEVFESDSVVSADDSDEVWVSLSKGQTVEVVYQW